MNDKYDHGLDTSYDNSASGQSMFPWEVDSARRAIWHFRRVESWLMGPESADSDKFWAWKGEGTAVFWDLWILEQAFNEMLNRGYKFRHPITGEEMGFNSFYYGLTRYFCDKIPVTVAYSWAFMWLDRKVDINWKAAFGMILGEQTKLALRSILEALERNQMPTNDQIEEELYKEGADRAILASYVYNACKDQMDATDFQLMADGEDRRFNLPRYGV